MKTVCQTQQTKSLSSLRGAHYFLSAPPTSKSTLLDPAGTDEWRLTACGEVGIPGKKLRCLLLSPGAARIPTQKMHIPPSSKVQSNVFK